LHAVAICLNGIWEEILLDDYIPCTPVSKNPAFNTSKQGELWVMMLEKAWAKVHDGYLNISAGLTREALRDLTGASAKTFFTDKNNPAKKKELWGVLCESFLNDHILCAGSDDLSGGSDAYIEKIGICGSHAYSLLGVYEIYNNQSIKLGSKPNSSKFN
jgi:calpain-15